ncbi:MATE family efflux transporter [Shewanella dokdonensis]|uniref:MATE family efflux transporter n=1 Tax=Shewanella dokdonensis TaxID=712036 RepID=A0ABX8DBT9_9GAMM|nr:MATE family efflux transporter [Shewanella dokdonensis]MCL1075459.1 MATE family efflux transporter [Shewanella dokdonensis]QVK22141.1 MATE family efflux transporter [Shewanella dokdonensis]
MRDRHGLLSQPIGRVLLNMSLPNMLGILTVLGFNLVDTFFISRLGTEALAAISFTFPVTLIISSIAIGIGAGVSTNLGRLIGAGHAPQAKVFLHDALLLTFLLISGLATLGSLFNDGLFTLMGAADGILPLVHQYMQIWYIGVPLLVLQMVGNQGLKATGDTRLPAQILALAAVINLILDPLLIFGIGPFPRLELQGAAIATVVSWVVALCFSGYLLVLKRHLLVAAPISISRCWANWKQLAHIAQPAAVMNLMNPLANALIMAMLARIDHAAVAAFGAGTRLESVLLIVSMALSSSVVPFVAQNLGACQKLRARAAVILSLRFVLVFQTLLYLPLALWAQPLARLFSDDPLVLEWLTFYIRVLPLAYGPLGVVIIVATALNAYHRPMASLMLNLCRLFVLMLPLAALGAWGMGVKGLLLALPISNLLMGLVSYLIALRMKEPANMPHPSYFQDSDWSGK